MRRMTYAALMVILVAALAGCAGGGGGAARPTVEGIPTPQGAFAQATTVMTPLPAATTPPGEAGDPAAGKTVYANKCASCHGANGEGVEGKGKGVAAWTMTAAEFEDILRTGGKGRLGNEHLYGPSQISPSGVANLYAFVRTLLKK